MISEGSRDTENAALHHMNELDFMVYSKVNNMLIILTVDNC